jgi:hypothetical protein
MKEFTEGKAAQKAGQGVQMAEGDRVVREGLVETWRKFLMEGSQLVWLWCMCK